MVSTLQELRQLLEILNSRGVTHFRSGDLELALTGPSFVSDEPVGEEDLLKPSWRDLPLEDAELLGVA